MAKQTKSAPAKATPAKAVKSAMPAKSATKPAAAATSVKEKSAPARRASTSAKTAPVKASQEKAIVAAIPPRPSMVNAYITFNGNCEAAFTYYRKVLGGEFAMMMRFRDMPPGAGQPMSKVESKMIMHVSLPVSRETALMGSDWPPSMPGFIQGTNMSVSLSVGSREEADRCFKGLSAKGKVTMPMSNTFWGSYFGMCTDKFGISWMIGFDQPQPQQN